MAERIDLFRRALAGAARAIARDAELEVVFASDSAAPGGKAARVPSPGPSLEPRLVAEARGAADSSALRARRIASPRTRAWASSPRLARVPAIAREPSASTRAVSRASNTARASGSPGASEEWTR